MSVATRVAARTLAGRVPTYHTAALHRASVVAPRAARRSVVGPVAAVAGGSFPRFSTVSSIWHGASGDDSLSGDGTPSGDSCLALAFPGQGSQFVGMGKDLAQQFPIVRETFEEVDEALGMFISREMTDGDHKTLQLTENAQPAILTLSVALVRVLELEFGLGSATGLPFHAALGHSLGEYSALVATGTLPLAVAVRLVRIRGEAMQMAVPVGVGAMSALMPCSLESAAEYVSEANGRKNELCAIANINSPSQIVISGHRGAVKFAGEHAKKKAGRRMKVVELNVSAPFHCDLMEPAAQDLKKAMQKITFETPRQPVISNVTAESVTDAAAIPQLLVEQVTAPVQWWDSVRFAEKELKINKWLSIGSGASQLSSLVMRSVAGKGGVFISVSDLDDIKRLR